MPPCHASASRFPSRAFAALWLVMSFAVHPLGAQVPVPLGAGSYASAVYLNAASGVRTVVIYNPQATTQPVAGYQNGLVVGNMSIPGRSLVSTTNLNYQPTAPLPPTGISATSGNGVMTI